MKKAEIANEIALICHAERREASVPTKQTEGDRQLINLKMNQFESRIKFCNFFGTKNQQKIIRDENGDSQFTNLKI